MRKETKKIDPMIYGVDFRQYSAAANVCGDSPLEGAKRLGHEDSREADPAGP